MDWTGGYVADIGYTAGFYRETAPSHMAFAALTIGRSPGRALAPKRVLELGFGIAHRLDTALPVIIHGAYANGGGREHVGRVGVAVEF